MTPDARLAGAVDGLRCRDDILQAMYWLHGEGLQRAPDLVALRQVLGEDAELMAAQLDLLTADRLVERDGARYRLTEAGIREGGRRFADEFADITRVAHGDCPPNCPHCANVPRDECGHCQSLSLDDAAWAT